MAAAGMGRGLLSGRGLRGLAPWATRAYTQPCVEANELLAQHLGGRKVVILTTKWWHQACFDQVMGLPPALAGQCEFFVVRDESAESLQVPSLPRSTQRPGPPCALSRSRSRSLALSLSLLQPRVPAQTNARPRTAGLH